jgi:hypothetical protein
VKIVVHIERLNVAGVNLTPAERRTLIASLQSELAGLVTARGIASSLQNGAALPSLPTPAVRIGGGFPGARAGREIADALYAGFGNPATGGDER